MDKLGPNDVRRVTDAISLSRASSSYLTMSLTPSDVSAAQALQDAAAHDSAPQVRLIAGPGTGKSQTIQEHVLWLLEHSVQASEIVVVSFTRASARDLELRIHKQKLGRPSADRVRVSTLHSLALRTLRRRGMLAQYPVDPIVLDEWELEHIFDAEFQYHSGISSKERRQDIRLYKEAIWSTGSAAHPGYRAPTPGGIATGTHEGTGILPKAACSRHPALAPSQFQRACLPESPLKIVFAAFVIPRDERAMFTLPPLPLLTGCSRVPTIPQVHYSHNDVAVYARFHC